LRNGYGTHSRHDTLAAGQPREQAKVLKSSISILLFFLLSGFFMSLLVGLLDHNRRLLMISGVLLVAIVATVYFLLPVKLPFLKHAA
jgi:hypothetical protein